MKIILLGYMASGKSTVSRLLANKLGIKSKDLDDYIVDKEGTSIQKIFKKKGEIYFRTQENKYLKELLDNHESFVLSLGGGTPCYSNNIYHIKNNSNSIYLKGSLNTLFKRLQQEKKSRPLISSFDNEKLKEFIAKHLFERSPFYEQSSHTVIIDNKTADQIVDEINALF